VVLSAEIDARGIYPPVDVLSSLSRLMRSGAGKGRTREDHLDVAAQVLAAMARARQAADLAELVGTAALSQTDRSYIAYRTLVEHGLLNQGRDEHRSLESTLDRAWAALATLPHQELTMLSTELLDRYLVTPT
jgi:V/A-type H+-transporting ATPase subunit B